MKIDILHLTTDEKFIDGIHSLFEKAFPGMNKFVVVVPPGFPKLKYIKNKQDVELLIKSPETVEILADKIKDSSVTVLHGMNEIWAKLVLESLKPKHFIYMVWGAEIYGNPLIYNNESLFGEQTKQLVLKEPFYKALVERAKDVYRKFKYPGYQPVDITVINTEIKKGLSEITGIGMLNKEEIDKFRQKKIIPESTIQYKITYYPLEYLIRNIDIKQKPGKNIWIGNSSALYNNHLEVFEVLKNIELTDRKIIVPLSYGPEIIGKKINKKGKEIFSEDFYPLKTFMPLKEYNKLLQSAGIVIMNAYRPHASGNVFTALYLGAKVFMSNKNTVYHFLKRLGCKVFLMEDLKDANDDKSILENLNERDIQNNREILEKEISERMLVKELQKDIGQLLK